METELGNTLDFLIIRCYTNDWGWICYKASYSTVLQMFFVEDRLSCGRNDHTHLLLAKNVILRRSWLKLLRPTTLG